MFHRNPLVPYVKLPYHISLNSLDFGQKQQEIENRKTIQSHHFIKDIINMFIKWIQLSFELLRRHATRGATENNTNWEYLWELYEYTAYVIVGTYFLKLIIMLEKKIGALNKTTSTLSATYEILFLTKYSITEKTFPI